MVKAAKFAAIFAVCILGGSTGAFAMARPPVGEKTCAELGVNAAQQADLDRRALGGDPTALEFRAACAWPISVGTPVLGRTVNSGAATERQEDRTKAEEIVKDAYFWTALSYCTSISDELKSYITSEPNRLPLSYSVNRRTRLDSVSEYFNKFDGYVREDAEANYQERLAQLGAPGLVTLARTVVNGCAMRAEPVVVVGILRAAQEAWANLGKAGLGISMNWKVTSFNLDQKLKDYTTWTDLNSPQEKLAESIKQSLLQGLAGDVGSLRSEAAISRMRNFGTPNLNWLLASMDNFKTFNGGSNPYEFSKGTLDAIGRLEFMAVEGRDLNPCPMGACDPVIYDDGDKMLTHLELRNLVCWVARSDKVASAASLIALGDLAAMYAYGYGYPKDTPKARAIIKQVFDTAKTITAYVDPNSTMGRVLQGYQPVWKKISELVNGDSNRPRRGQRSSSFVGDENYPCPAKYNLP